MPLLQSELNAPLGDAEIAQAISRELDRQMNQIELFKTQFI